MNALSMTTLLVSLILIGFGLPIAGTEMKYQNHTFKEAFSPQTPAPDMPSWMEQPANQTIELGDRFELTVSILVGEVGYEWRVSDEENFVIGTGSEPNTAIVQDTHVLDIGVYFLRITVWDLYYDRLTADIYIHVEDSQVPVIDPAEDLEFVEGTLGHNITWIARDANPSHYTIEMNGILLEEGPWEEEICRFYLIIYNLKAGTYTCTLTVWDLGYNTASSSATVYVSPNPNATDNAHNPRLRSGGSEKVIYVSKPDILFIEIFAAVIFSGLAGLVMISAIAGKKHEFGFS